MVPGAMFRKTHSRRMTGRTDHRSAGRQSVPAVAGSQSASLEQKAPRSVPSMPKVGIPRSLQNGIAIKSSKCSVLAAWAWSTWLAIPGSTDWWRSTCASGARSRGRIDGAVFVKRFEREARLQASLDHPHICSGSTKSAKCRATPPTIRAILHRHAADQWQSRCIWPNSRCRCLKSAGAAKVADAMHAAHRQGLIHRDIKPSNIMVERTADGKLASLRDGFWSGARNHWLGQQPLGDHRGDAALYGA